MLLFGASTLMRFLWRNLSIETIIFGIFGAEPTLYTLLLENVENSLFLEFQNFKTDIRSAKPGVLSRNNIIPQMILNEYFNILKRQDLRYSRTHIG